MGTCASQQKKIILLTNQDFKVVKQNDTNVSLSQQLSPQSKQSSIQKSNEIKFTPSEKILLKIDMQLHGIIKEYQKIETDKLNESKILAITFLYFLELERNLSQYNPENQSQYYLTKLEIFQQSMHQFQQFFLSKPQDQEYQLYFQKNKHTIKNLVEIVDMQRELIGLSIKINFDDGKDTHQLTSLKDIFQILKSLEQLNDDSLSISGWGESQQKIMISSPRLSQFMSPYYLNAENILIQQEQKVKELQSAEAIQEWKFYDNDKDDIINNIQQILDLKTA